MAFDFGKLLQGLGTGTTQLGQTYYKGKMDMAERTRQERLDEEKRLLDELAKRKLGLEIGGLEREQTRLPEGEAKLAEYLDSLSQYQKKQGEYDAMVAEREAHMAQVGPNLPMPEAPTKPEPGYLAYGDVPAVKAYMDMEGKKDKANVGLFAGWKAKNDQRDMIFSGINPFGPRAGKPFENDEEATQAMNEWEIRWNTSGKLGITDPYIEGAAEKSRQQQLAQIPGKVVETGATTEERVRREAETETEINTIPGFKKVEGARVTNESVAKIKNLSPDIETMKTLADELIQKYNKMGSEFTGDDAADYSSKVRNLQLLAKSPSLYNLGVLTGPDLMLLEQSIPNPASIKEGIKKQVLGDISVKLKNFRDLIELRGDQFYKVNGFEREKTKPKSKKVGRFTIEEE